MKQVCIITCIYIYQLKHPTRFKKKSIAVMLLNSKFKTLSTLICISFFLNNNRRQLMYWTIKGHTFWMRLCLDTIYALTLNPFTAETLQFASIDMYKVVHSLYNNIQLYLIIILTPYLYIFVRNCSVICS